MILFLIALFLFFVPPFLWIAVAFWSKAALVAGGVFAIFGMIWFFMTAFSRFAEHWKATPLDEAGKVAQALKRVETRLGFEKTTFEFWEFPSAAARYFIWFRNKQHRVVFLSRGLISTATEAQFEQILLDLLQCEYASISLHHRIDALLLWWESLKGSKETFRYWFFSFWFYPLERLLKIAKM